MCVLSEISRPEVTRFLSLHPTPTEPGDGCHGDASDFSAGLVRSQWPQMLVSKIIKNFQNGRARVFVLLFHFLLWQKQGYASSLLSSETRCQSPPDRNPRARPPLHPALPAPRVECERGKALRRTDGRRWFPRGLSQPRHRGVSGWVILCRGVCPVHPRLFATSLALTHWMSVAPPTRL